MKTNKYTSRKFLIAVGALIVSVVALLLANDMVALCGLGVSALYICAEGYIDEAGIVKRSVSILDNVSRETSKGEKDGSKDKA